MVVWLLYIINYYIINSTPLVSDNVKWLFDIMVYGGTPNGWVKKLGESKKEYKGKEIINFTIHHPFVLLFEKECLAMSDMVFENNTPIVTKVRGEKV